MRELIHEALLIVILLSVVPMAAIAVGAGLVTVLQAITQVQEQSLTHLARLAVLTVVMIIFGQHGYELLEQIAFRAFSMVNRLE